MTNDEFIKLFKEALRKLNLETEIKINEKEVVFPVGKWSSDETEKILTTISDYIKHGKNSH